MLRILEMAWLFIALISCAISGYQYFAEGWVSAVWMLGISVISFVMYTIRRKQRISYESAEYDQSE
ncbi:MAG: hypothetical protein RL021_2231 [Bacteroidota bacterium]